VLPETATVVKSLDLLGFYARSEIGVNIAYIASII
jgi:hypothetical protein